MSVRHPGLRRALTRPAGALAALTVATSAMLVGATASPAAAQASSAITLSPMRVQRPVGQTQNYVATLASGSTRLASKNVVFYVRATTTRTWTQVATRTTNGSGQAGITLTAKQSMYVAVKFPGTSAFAASRSGDAFLNAVSALGSRAVTEASRHQGKPYQWGAVGPDRFDCSGFTRYVFARFGKSLPHNSGQQYGSVRHVAKSSIQVGDLIFNYDSSGIYHVGIYAGGNTMWHAPHSGDVVKRSTIWNNNYYVGRVA